MCFKWPYVASWKEEKEETQNSSEPQGGLWSARSPLAGVSPESCGEGPASLHGILWAPAAFSLGTLEKPVLPALIARAS